jgi:hypothetical protein
MRLGTEWVLVPKTFCLPDFQQPLHQISASVKARRHLSLHSRSSGTRAGGEFLVYDYSLGRHVPSLVNQSELPKSASYRSLWPTMM